MLPPQNENAEITHSPKKGLGVTVLEATEGRIRYVFETFPRIYLSYSGGKDSTVMLHLVMTEAVKRGVKVGVLFVDLEAQYTLTIDHIQECYDLYAEHIEPFWVALPIHLRNAVSQFEPHWVCWDKSRQEDWVRSPPPMAITDESHFPFFKHGMEFEEFVPAFGHWYGQGELTACFVGIRSDESLNRYRTINGSGWKSSFEGIAWTTWMSRTLYNAYPIYDWRVEDIWTYHGKTGKPHNLLYDRMHQAGLTLSQMRICQPYGDDQRKGLWLFHLIEPETWARIIARVNGANSGALYIQESGNINGTIKVTKPEGHTWQSFAELLLSSQPPLTQEHFRNKIAVFLHWWYKLGYIDGIPDEADPKLEAARKAPSWRRICKALLRNDYWCKGMSFGQTKSDAYDKYKQVMKNRRKKWGM